MCGFAPTVGYYLLLRRWATSGYARTHLVTLKAQCARAAPLQHVAARSLLRGARLRDDNGVATNCAAAAIVLARRSTRKSVSSGRELYQEPAAV